MADIKEYMHLKSGTDIRGVASEGAGEAVELTDEKVYSITRAFVKWLCEKSNNDSLVISVGHDSRVSADRIKGKVIEALTESGITVKDCGLCSTPAMFMTTVDLSCDGAVQITASHHPWHRNGLKFFTRDGGLDGADIEKILVDAYNGKGVRVSGESSVTPVDFMDIYCKRLRKMICDGVNADDFEHPLKGYKIAVDAGNGVGGFYADKVLEPLGADVSGSRFLEPDGMFPNHIPNPEKKEAMDAISDAVVTSGSDFGVIFDTDVDRAACVDETGKEINRNRLVALAAAIALEGNENGTIVTDSVTSSGLKEFIEKDIGGIHWRFKRGYKNVINEQIRLNGEGINCPLAIETSGHAALRENYYLDDGAYLITKIIIKMAQLGKHGKKLADLISTLKEPVEAKEYRFSILTEDFRAYGNEVIAALERYSSENGFVIADDNREGIRVSVPEYNGWFLLRLSVHDPIMPMNIESDITGGVDGIKNKILPFFEKCERLDISPLQ